MKEKTGSSTALSRLPSMRTSVSSAIALIALAALCSCTLAQEMTAEDWYKRGQDLEEKGSNDEAIAAYDIATQLDPDNATIWGDLAWNLDVVSRRNHNLGEYNKALQAYNKSIDLYDRLLEAEPLNSETWYEKGVIFSKRADGRGSAITVLGINNVSAYRDWDHDHDEAIGCLDKSIEINPLYAPAWLLKGWMTLHFPTKSQEAINCFEKAIELDPNNSNLVADALAGKAAALAISGKQNESIEAFDSAIQETPNSSQLWIDKAVQFADQGNYEETIKAFDRAAEIDPQNIYVWLSRGLVLSRNLSRYNESIDAYDRALQINPKDINAWNGKGDALKALGRNSEADESYAKAKELERVG